MSTRSDKRRWYHLAALWEGVVKQVFVVFSYGYVVSCSNKLGFQILHRIIQYIHSLGRIRVPFATFIYISEFIPILLLVCYTCALIISLFQLNSPEPLQRNTFILLDFLLSFFCPNGANVLDTFSVWINQRRKYHEVVRLLKLITPMLIALDMCNSQDYGRILILNTYPTRETDNI